MESMDDSVEIPLSGELDSEQIEALVAIIEPKIKAALEGLGIPETLKALQDRIDAFNRAKKFRTEEEGGGISDMDFPKVGKFTVIVENNRAGDVRLDYEDRMN